MIITDAVSFGAAIREKRKEKGYTQTYLSGVTGFSVSFISDLENGKSTIELGRALTLANVLGMDLMMVSRGTQPL